MKIYHNIHPMDSKDYDTERLREEYLCPDLFEKDSIKVVYSHIDRLVAIGVVPNKNLLKLDDFIDNKQFGTNYFLERRELGIVNLGGKVEVRYKGGSFILEHLDALYLSKETESVEFLSLNESEDNCLYCLSAPAHHKYENKLIQRNNARMIKSGSQENANARVIYQYLHPEVVQTCQLCLGVTHLEPGSVWNTMPAHTHVRRMEIYLYFNIKPSQVVFHFMGEPSETRHLIIRDKQAVFSPSWSIHSGCGTQNYSFVWGMAGENQTYDDMDFVNMDEIK
ncbi:4-deoxy-L-threo-5-hexosulose-uronate ketol-isomerase [Cricetibacter osteomyelitidis]|uniref:4-deoxy-L-threo-5-hexosulose-uronate ketol-isomerase n=1 Tax=Cricetibacter osteomyelitidis TaxID=1521931 RepID=A0A4R2T4Y2_9PAST|nr:5-dehydro-4-deoxy-D-glucuronate isomerase [Cricetibacter osteomyelitidis]TCP96581.1 4-deoxy-L-threo-5-hexosulose-uronate ketol-isomerase [Cricetibacter osteomyelitidis]